jgi:hypothetical protein
VVVFSLAPVGVPEAVHLDFWPDDGAGVATNGIAQVFPRPMFAVGYEEACLNAFG